MRAVIQRVAGASLKVGGELISQIDKGLLIFLGVGVEDEQADLEKIAAKIPKLRIFEDENGKMNLSVKDVQGQILLVSQFTLYADCKGCNRPSFIKAERPERANAMYLQMRDMLSSQGVDVKTGEFGADMKIDAKNDGPVTIIFDSKNL